MAYSSQAHFPHLVAAIDEGTSSARVLVFSSQTSRLVASHQIPVKKQFPKEGWVEQDPEEILKAVRTSIDEVAKSLKDKDIPLTSLAAVGVTNQRETTILWDKTTGRPLHNAIVWLDMRTASTLDKLVEKVPGKSKNHLKHLCGLPLSPYFSALKIRWLMDHVPAVQQAIRNKTCLFGNVDSWLIWNLTGGVKGGLHMTDVTNASRTMLMNLNSLKWDPKLCKFFDIPVEILPEVYSSSEIYTRIKGGPFDGIPISGCLGDQHAALVGQQCFEEGQAKSTYGTGCFLLCNTGNKIVGSEHGLLTTVGYQLGRGTAPVYALEGSVAVAGAAFAWLQHNLGLVNASSEIETLAASASPHSGDVYFVPAFSGLYAPYWQPNARGVICGITEETQRCHILKATLEAICFQTRDVIEAMNKDTGRKYLRSLKVDGGMIHNNLLMQLQADLCGMTIVRPHMAETTALGAAMAAGSAKGIEVWDMDDLKDSEPPSDVFSPKTTKKDRDERYNKWKMAVERSFDWVITEN